MQLTGQSLILGQWLGNTSQTSFNAFSPSQHKHLDSSFYNVTDEQLALATKGASEAFKQYRQTSEQQRAEFLDTIAEEILKLGGDLLEITAEETALPHERLMGERMRTVNQLHAFAEGLRSPIDSPIEDTADPERQPLPKPATLLKTLPLGPVAVFGASNFPYAFSTLGGDTASALAAGCPVIVKGHPAHPGTGELMAKAVERAIQRCKMPAGVFSMLQSQDPDLSHALVKDPAIKAVGFTGSLNVATLLQQSINQRQEPIPFYGELGSINPQIVLPHKTETAATDIAQQLCQSLMMGNGQFCTSPGIWLVPADAEQFFAAAKESMIAQNSGPLLTPGILNNYKAQTQELLSNQQLTLVAQGKNGPNFHAVPHLFSVKGQDFIQDKKLHEEVFGPCALIVTYHTQEELLEIIESLTGQLTASIHATETDLQQSSELIESLGYKVGRLIFNQMPTGVEVCASMNHGGPYPSSTDIRSTSVGLTALRRFQRPICYQNLPDSLQ